MRAGALRFPITITAPLTAQDDYGQLIASAAQSTPVHACNADINSATSKEIYALGAGFTAQVTHKVTIRWIPTPITNGMSVVYGDRTFLVQVASDPTMRQRELDIFVLEQTK